MKPLLILFIICATSSDNTLLKQVVSGLLESIPYNERDSYNRIASPAIEGLVSRGFEHFSQEMFVQQIDSIAYESLPKLQVWMKDLFNMPTSHYLEKLIPILRRLSSTEWVLFEAAFSATRGANCGYALALARNDRENSQVSLLIGNLRSSFNLTSELFISRHTTTSLFGLYEHQSEYLEELPANVTKDDVEILFNYFNVLILDRFAEVLDLAPERLKYY